MRGTRKCSEHFMFGSSARAEFLQGRHLRPDRQFFVKADSNRQQVLREQFQDGSALVTNQNGSVLILESNLAKTTTLREGKPVNYNEPRRLPLSVFG